MTQTFLHNRKTSAFLLTLDGHVLALIPGCTVNSTATRVALATTSTSTSVPSLTSTTIPTPSAPINTPTDTRSPTTRPIPTRTPLPVTPVRPTVARTVAPTRTAAPRPTPTPPAAGPSATPGVASRVYVRRSGDQFTLLVNGQPTYIKGMNYNVNYTNLPEDTQLEMHRRDFKIMRDAGVNAIIGWGIYDEITLDVAAEFGIGVIMPFPLDPQGSYENQDYRNEIVSNFRDYIKRFKDFPAVWGWNPGGDELIYQMKNAQSRTVDKLQFAADLELELAQVAHTMDPNHINVIKEPRDWYIKYLNVSLQNARKQPSYTDLSTSLVYGVNVYGHTDDIQLALGNAKLTLTGQLGIGMLVSEFGPFNSPRAERATNYANIWYTAARITTIGAMVYVFGPDQPNPTVANPYDPLTLLPSEYSLVDMNGAPVDGALAALTAKWLAFSAPIRLPSVTPTVKP